MSYENNIRCNCCGEIIDNSHVFLEEKVRASYGLWSRLFHRYNYHDYHICTGCWNKMRCHIADEPTCPDCGSALNTNWGHCPDCDEWREL